MSHIAAIEMKNKYLQLLEFCNRNKDTCFLLYRAANSTKFIFIHGETIRIACAYTHGYFDINKLGNIP